MRYILIYVLFFLSLGFTLSTQNQFSPFSLVVVITSLFIQFFSLYNIFSRNKEPFSLNKIFFLFALFFFGIAPLIQYFNQTIIWFKRPLNESEYILTNTIIIIILILYSVFYYFFRHVKLSTTNVIKIQIFKSNQINLDRRLDWKRSLILIGISLLSFFIVFQSNNYNLLAMLIRGGDLLSEILSSGNSDDSPTKWLIINNFVRPTAMLSFLYYAITPQKSKLVFLILLFIAIFTCFPTAMPRFAAAALYLPFLLILFPIFKRKYLFNIVFILSLLVIFPSLDLFRTFSDSTEIAPKLEFDMFEKGHFDSYQNFAIILSNNIITYGYQLLGVLFFWIPRTFWPYKPVGSGTYIAEKLNFSFDNVSANFFAEGYINFGYFGIFLFVLFMAFVTARADNFFWKDNKQQYNSLKSLIYLVSIGFIFFVLRGDLLSSVAYFIGFISSLCFVYKIINFRFYYE